jgi:hypothetical protein
LAVVGAVREELISERERDSDRDRDREKSKNEITS